MTLAFRIERQCYGHRDDGNETWGTVSPKTSDTQGASRYGLLDLGRHYEHSSEIALRWQDLTDDKNIGSGNGLVP